MIKLIFFGSPQNAADLLVKLDKDKRFSIIAVVTQPDRPIGRKQILTSTPVAQYAEKNSIITLKPPCHPQKKHLLKNPKKLINQIQKIASGQKLDLILSYEFGQLIPKEILAIPSHGSLNIHFSLLPSYRGAAPLAWQIVNGEKETGISIVKMSAIFDQGLLIYQEKHPIAPSATTQTLHKRLSSRVLEIIPDLLEQYLKNFSDFPYSPDTSSNNLEPRTLNIEREASYYPRLTRQDGYIPWQDFLLAINKGTTFINIEDKRQTHYQLAQEIERKIRAFSPWPGVWTQIKSDAFNKMESVALKKLNGKRLKILSAKLENGKLVPLKVQLSGEKAKKWKDLSGSLFTTG